MAIYRNIQMSFWTDSKIIDEFMPQDKLFYLYLFTNPHTNLCGCYEISKSQMVLELGYKKEIINELIERFVNVHEVIQFNNSTKELLLLNWHKYNWTNSDKFRKALQEQINEVKTPEFREYLMNIFNGIDTVSIPYVYPMHTTDTDTDTVYNNYNNILNLYNSVCSNFKECKTLTKPRIDKLKELMNAFTENEIKEVFEKANKMPYLFNGKNNIGWKAGFDWIITIENFVKVQEGLYEGMGSKGSATDMYRDTMHGNYDFEALERELKERR